MNAEDRTIMANSFENMMKLAEYAASRHNERRQVIFRVFISYMTLLVAISGLIMNNWRDEFIESGSFVWGVSALLLGMFITYFLWLRAFYITSDYDARRRSFYLTKAEVISYHMSKDLNRYYSACEKVYPYLANNKYLEIDEKRLFKDRKPHSIRPKDIEKSPVPPTVKCNLHFYFHICAPLGVTILIVVALSIKFFTDNGEPSSYPYMVGIF